MPALSDLVSVYQEIEAREKAEREELVLVRQVLTRVLGATPDPEPKGDLRYRLPQGGYDDIFHARVRWFGSTDGAIGLVKQLGWLYQITDCGDAVDVRLYDGRGVFLARGNHPKPARALVEAVLAAAAVRLEPENNEYYRERTGGQP